MRCIKAGQFFVLASLLGGAPARHEERLLLGPGKSGPAPAPLEILRKDPFSGATECAVQDACDVVEARAEGARSVVLELLGIGPAGGPEGKGSHQGKTLVRVRPVFSRAGVPGEVTLFLGKKKRAVLRSPTPASWKGFAVSLCEQPARKVACGLHGASDRVLWGGAVAPPDPVPRSAPATGEGLPLREASELPPLAVGHRCVVTAWNVQAQVGAWEVWAAGENSSPVRLTSQGRFPQLAAGESFVYCVWQVRDAAFLSRSSDRGKTWEPGQLVFRAPELACLRAAARGKRLVLLYRCAEGICWHLSEDRGESFVRGGPLPGPCAKVRGVLTPRSLLVTYLRKGPAGYDAFLTEVALPKGPHRTELLVGAPLVRDVVAYAEEEGWGTVSVLREGEEVRLAHRMPNALTYLLPPVRGEPFLPDVSRWKGRLCVSFWCAEQGGNDVSRWAFLSDDDGFTWQGPVRLVSGRSLCVRKLYAVVGWSGGGGGALAVNGQHLTSLPGNVSSGRAVVALPLSRAHVQGWIQDRISYRGSGNATVELLFHTLRYEEVAYGKDQVHARQGAAWGNLCGEAADVTLIASGLTEERLSGRCATVLRLSVGIRNTAANVARGVKLAVLWEGKLLQVRECPDIDPGEERHVTLQVPLGDRPGTYRLQLRARCENERNALDNAGEFTLRVLPAEDRVLATGERTALEISGQKHLRLYCPVRSYLLFQSTGAPAGELAAELRTAEGRQGLDVRKASDVPPGRHVLLLSAPEGKTVSLTVLLAEKRDPFEPNDTPRYARSLRPGTTLPVSFSPRGDRDWFSIAVPETGHLQFALEGEEQAEVVVSVRRRGADWLVNDVALPASLAVGSGTYELLFAERWDRDMPEEVGIRVDLIASGDPGEPNDLRSQARVLTPGGEGVRFNLFPTFDVDWFVVEVSRSGYLTLTAAAPGTERVEAGFFDGKGRPLPGGAPLPVSLRVDPGRRFVRLRADVPFRELCALRAQFMEEFDPTEPNDTKAQAVALTLPARFQVALWPPSDEDWFSVTLPEEGYVHLDVPEGRPQRGMPAAAVWSGRGVERSLVLLPAVVRLGKGVWYLQLRSVGKEVQRVLFPVSVSFSQEVDPAEPNDEPQSAVPLACPGSRKVILWPQSDQDYLRVETSRGGYLLLKTSGSEKQPVEFVMHRPVAPNRVRFGTRAVWRVSPGVVLVSLRATSTVREPLVVTVEAELRPEIDSHEPNDTGGKVYVITPGVQVSSALYPGDDVDLFGLSVKTGGRFTLTVGSGAPAGLNWDVLREGGKVLFEGLRPGRPVPLRRGMYFLKLYDARARGAYRVFSFQIEPR